MTCILDKSQYENDYKLSCSSYVKWTNVMSVRLLSLRTKTLFCTYMLPPRGRTKPNFAAQLQTDRNLESILDMRLHVCIHGCARMELGSADRSSTLSPEAPEHSSLLLHLWYTHALSAIWTLLSSEQSTWNTFNTHTQGLPQAHSTGSAYSLHKHPEGPDSMQG